MRTLPAMNLMTPRSLSTVLLAASSMVLGGCVLMDFMDVKEQQASLAAACRISGSVTNARAEPRPIVVVLFREADQAAARLQDRWKIVDHFVMEQPGRWGFGTGPGQYAVGAFEDRSRDLIYQPGESYGTLAFDQPLVCGSGTRFRDLALAIPEKVKDPFPAPLDIATLQARNQEGQLDATMGQLTATGEIVALSDARFSEENAEDGLWRPFDFLVESHAGVYFLEPYDPKRIPVLFVHGINGTPASFDYLIERLDRSRFQPWVYYYPSGIHLGATAGHLNQTMAKLKLRHGFQRFAVVAHSMGGLVSRGFIQRHAKANANDIPLFVTISTPWGGAKSAEAGVKRAPIVVHVWRDMAPGSDYQKSLYSQPLPSGLQHHLVFTFNRKTASFGESDDQGVTVASQLLPQAQRDAAKLYGFDDTHTGVLRDSQVSLLINQLLEERFR
jgi:pimeloyl-ACP methyl ester carboxylesterase